MPEPIAEPVAVAQPFDVAAAECECVASAESLSATITEADSGVGEELMADSPFLQSVERRRPGTSMRNYVTRTLPHTSAVVVSNRAPHEPRPEGGFARGAGGVVTALLTIAEVTSADWISCARTEAERAMVENQGSTIVAPLGRSTTKLHYVMPTPEQYHR